MNKGHKNLWKMLMPVALFAVVAGQASAQAEVISSAGSVGNEFSCTLGESFVSEEAGFWVEAVQVAAGIVGVYTDGDVQVANLGDGSMNITIPQELIASGAFYSIYDLSGRLLDKGEIVANPTHVDYAARLNGKPIIITVDAAKAGRLATFKVVK